MEISENDILNFFSQELDEEDMPLLHEHLARCEHFLENLSKTDSLALITVCVFDFHINSVSIFFETLVVTS
jgi:hypothetical protein